MDDTLNIGALSRMTGIPTDTLRTWERRYGFPQPERTESGHRRYSLNTCERLRQIRRLLDHGYRPSAVLGWSDREILAALEVSEAADVPRRADDSASSSELGRLIEYARTFAADDLDRAFEQAWTRMAALDFLEDWLAPFLRELGDAWASNRVGVQHEHFVSARLQQFLTTKWRPLADRSLGPMVACATLTGEAHTLGLQLAAMALALADCRVLYLGAEMPVLDLALACQQQRVRGLLISVSETTPRERATSQLTELRSELGSLPIVVGGAGAPTTVTGVEHLASLRDLQRWTSRL